MMRLGLIDRTESYSSPKFGITLGVKFSTSTSEMAMRRFKRSRESCGSWHLESRGSESIRVYGLDRLDRSRKDAWVSLKAGLKEYGRAMREQRFKQTQDQRQALCRAPFSSQLAYLLKITQDTRKTDVEWY